MTELDLLVSFFAIMAKIAGTLHVIINKPTTASLEAETKGSFVRVVGTFE